MDDEPGVRNRFIGESCGSVVQAGTIQHVWLAGTWGAGAAQVDCPPRQLPLAIRDFIGCAEYLAALDAILADGALDGASKAVVIWAVDGAAGIGKPEPGL